MSKADLRPVPSQAPAGDLSVGDGSDERVYDYMGDKSTQGHCRFSAVPSVIR